MVEAVPEGEVLPVEEQLEEPRVEQVPVDSSNLPVVTEPAEPEVTIEAPQPTQEAAEEAFLEEELAPQMEETPQVSCDEAQQSPEDLKAVPLESQPEPVEAQEASSPA